MGRHAADRTAPGSPDPERRGKAAGPRPSRRGEQAEPTPGSAAGRISAERTAQAFDRLVEPHRAALRAFILRLAEGDEAVADSVFEETLYRAAQDPDRYPNRRPAVRPWLMLTARNVLRDGITHHQPDAGPEQVPSTTIVAALEDLPAVHRELIIELFYRGVSLEEAAADYGVPVQTIRFRLYFAMRALHAVLDQHVADRHGTH
jgi:RNA polymerase sigma-70 factor (ECF subfamily)